MLAIHADWQPPRSPAEQTGIFFWAEDSESPPPTWQRGRMAQKPKPKDHPFCASIHALQRALGKVGKEGVIALQLPTTRTGPLPSPSLIHTWELDRQSPPRLHPWLVKGLQLDPGAACLTFLELTSGQRERKTQRILTVLGDDARFWSRAAALALETLVTQKILPILIPTNTDQSEWHARWLAVLDGSKDGPRLAQLETAMPPLCRARLAASGDTPAPRMLLVSFLNALCDALARRWGHSGAPLFPGNNASPAHAWLEALFSDDPAIEASPAQLQALAASHHAWMRNLHLAGDADFRIAFRLESPQTDTDAPAWRLNYLLQANDDPSLLVPAEAIWKKTGDIINKLGHRFEKPQERLLAGLGYAARLFPPISSSLKRKCPSHIALETQAAYTFLRQAAPLLESAGFGLLVPPWWNQRGARLGMRLKLRPREKQESNAVGRMSFERLIDYQWELSVGDTALSEEEFRALATLKSPLVQIRGQWVTLDTDQIDAAIRFWEKQQTEGEMGMLEALQYGLGGPTTINGLPLDEVTSEGWLADWLERLTHSEKLTQLPQPSGFHGQLRPYQLYGYSWLRFHRKWGLGACLADDMGLGKTIQAIALLLQEKESSGVLPAPSLLIAPTSVVTNWEREIRRFAPALTTLVHQGANRLPNESFCQAARNVDMVLTSYPILRLDLKLLQPIEWLAVIADEAQNIKNPTAKQSQAIRQLKAEFRLAMTGTPIENRLSELWSIMHFLNPGYLGQRERFRSDFALPIERYQNEEALDRLKQLISPFMLRRVKTDRRVITDLPQKVETKAYCQLTEEQATLYEAVVQNSIRTIEQQEQGIERRGLVFSMLMQLKQICNHPLQYLHQTTPGSSDPIDIASIAERSGKLERLTELLEEILAQNERVLIFTQFAEMGQLLADFLPQAAGASTQFLHGGTPAKVRDQMVRRFQEDEHAPSIFILSLKAGGTGLNLTRANYVIHFDRWWNPAVEDQATDRAFRIGQKRNVQVHKFVTIGTLEEMIDDMIEGKKGLAQAIIGSGEQWLTELTTDELRDMVVLRRG